MLIPNTPRSRLPGLFITGELRLPGVLIIGELRLKAPWCHHSRESFWTPGSRFTDFKEHTTVLDGAKFKNKLIGVIVYF
jgi:hypothetical protein